MGNLTHKPAPYGSKVDRKEEGAGITKRVEGMVRRRADG